MQTLSSIPGRIPDMTHLRGLPACGATSPGNSEQQARGSCSHPRPIPGGPHLLSRAGTVSGASRISGLAPDPAWSMFAAGGGQTPICDAEQGMAQDGPIRTPVPLLVGPWGRDPSGPEPTSPGCFPELPLPLLLPPLPLPLPLPLQSCPCTTITPPPAGEDGLDAPEAQLSPCVSVT